MVTAMYKCWQELYVFDEIISKIPYHLPALKSGQVIWEKPENTCIFSNQKDLRKLLYAESLHQKRSGTGQLNENSILNGLDVVEIWLMS